MGEELTEGQIGWSDRDGLVCPIEVCEAVGFLRLAPGRSRTS